MTDPARFALDARDIVGESVVWDDRTDRLCWVDIIGKRIHSFDPKSRDHRISDAPDFVTSIGLREDGRFVVGLTKSIVIWDGEDRFEPFSEIETDLPGNRLNEGVVGPDGAFWVGTMQNNIALDGSPKDITASTGRLYRVTREAEVIPLTEDRFGITNTMAWTEDGRFITADTLKNKIYSYKIGPNASLSDRRTILANYDRGLPDGSTMDAEGHVWNCRVVGGAGVLRFSATGAVDRFVDLPCSWPTSCCFGGADLATLYITSARFTMTDAHLSSNPQEGGLFSLRLPIRGQAPRRMR